jgi:DNA-directed RNA polymerase subunit K/omega
MNYKEIDAPDSTITRDIVDIDSKTGNVYEAITIVAKRANQIGLQMKEELNSKLAEFATATDNLDEVFENREQIEISKFYESLPKPNALAIHEFMEDKIYFRDPKKDIEE